MTRDAKIGRQIAPLAMLLVLWIAQPALAHKMNVFASVEGNRIEGSAYFRGQIAAQNVTIRALDPVGEELGRTTTDAEGKFHFAARFRCDYRLVAETDDGHGADFTVAADQLPADLPARAGAPHAVPPAPTMATAEASARNAAESDAGRELAAIRAELARLAEHLKAYEDRLRLQDILGAIGYIVGITGIAYYYLGARRNRMGGTP